MIGLPVLFNGHPTVFDLPPAVYPDDDYDYDSWTAEQFEKLRNGLPQHHGEVFRCFMMKIVANREIVIGKANEDIAAFEAKMAKYATSPVRADIIGKFGVLYAGGMAAIDANVLPISETLVFKAVHRACKASLGSLPDPDAHLSADLLSLKGALSGAGMMNGDEASTSQKRLMSHADGYFEAEHVGMKFVMRSATFSKQFPSKPRAQRVLEWLDDEGHLRHQRDRKAGASQEWAQTHTQWPDGSRVRSIVMYFAGGLDSLAT